ncbi:uncharacterized protein LOC132060752 [Lycium ferocissimum]|uniref:uncharacterized protein LOC132060752 n=1 Tax=Lycium ferocissimum TaxID=112874 RepID=UPI0028151B39|nr:uncharacterized protein LOC132060752 [Lycium ferocissimum]
MDLTSLLIPPLYDHLFPPISDEDFKLYHTVDRRLYAKLINLLGRDPSESMNVMAFLQWLEVVGRNLRLVTKLYDIPYQLLNEVAEEVVACLKCTKIENFNENGFREIYLIPNVLNRKFTLKFIHENRASVIRGVTDFLERVCLRAFDDIEQQPNFLTRGSLVPTPNVLGSMNKDYEIGSSSGNYRMVNNPSNHVQSGGGIFLESMIPSENKIEEIGGLTSSRVMSIISLSHFLGGASGTSNIEEMGGLNSSRMMPIINPNHFLVGASGTSNIEEMGSLNGNTMMSIIDPNHFLGGAIGTSNIEEMGSLNGSRMMSIINPNHFLGGPSGTSNIEEMGGRNSSRMMPIINPNHFLGGASSISNIEEIGSLNNSRMMSIINPASHVFGAASGGTSNIEEIARRANGMVPMNPTHNVPGAAGGGIPLGLPNYFVPNQMVQYMPTPFLGGSAMNLLPPTPYGIYSHASASGSGVFHPQMLPAGPRNYHHDFGDIAQAHPAMHTDLADLLNMNNLNIHAVEEEKEVSPDDRTVFLTFSKGYPITEAEVKEFFTRKFGDDVLAVYMQEVTDPEEQALYARLVCRSHAALEEIVDGGRAKYNINGKHVWARKYVKKTNPKLHFVGQTSSPVTSTSD